MKRVPFGGKRELLTTGYAGHDPESFLAKLHEHFDNFRDHLSQQDEALDGLYDLAIRSRCCLICLEHHAEECHRSVVADVVASRNGHKLRVRHV